MAGDLRYTVQTGDTFQSVAAAHGIDHWEDLWEHNKQACPEPELEPLGKDGQPVVLSIPRYDPDAAKARLASRFGDEKEAGQVLGGTSWLDPRGLVSALLVDDDGAPLDGVEVVIEDPVLGTEEVVKTVQGRVEKRLPRKDFTMQARIFPGWDDSFGFFKRMAKPGDLGEEQLITPDAPSATPAAPPTADAPRVVAGLAASRLGEPPEPEGEEELSPRANTAVFGDEEAMA